MTPLLWGLLAPLPFDGALLMAGRSGLGAVRTSITDWRGSNSQDRTKSNSCEKKHNQHLLPVEIPTILSTYKNKVDEMLEAGVEVSGLI